MKTKLKFISIALSLLILSSNLRVVVTYAYYELDPIGFIERFCENIDRPELACNGKCQLKKVNESKNGDEQTPVEEFSLERIFFLVYTASIDKLVTTTIKKTANSNYLNLYKYQWMYFLEHPPQASFA